MHRNTRSWLPYDFSLYFSLLIALLGVLWLAGGASRPDVLGQGVVRGAAWLALLAVILFGERPNFKNAKTVLAFFVAILVSVLLQLVPLPPSIWQTMPGRDLLIQAASVSGQPQPWRPLSISPSATVNAAASLVVPFTVVLLSANLTERERSLSLGLLLGVVVASTLVGLLQFTGASFGNPFVNEDLGELSGTFANRNHFALLVAIGCLLAPAWAFRDGRRAHWRAPVALGLILLFILMILASGSRAGILVGVIALTLGMLLSSQGIRRELRHAPRWVLPVLIVAIIGTIAVFVLISIAADRAVSITRVLDIEVGADIRRRSLSIVLSMIQSYFPAGNGYGTFDAAFRMHEPLDLLMLTYFNHAHNDFLEVVMNGGLPGLLLLVAALVWWTLASLRAWRAGSRPQQMLPRLGSAMLLLIFVASAFDYPARTPIIMAIVAVAAVWLGGASFTAARAISIGIDDLPSFPKDSQAHA